MLSHVNFVNQSLKKNNIQDVDDKRLKIDIAGYEVISRLLPGFK